jgi:hypothetical protein
MLLPPNLEALEDRTLPSAINAPEPVYHLASAESVPNILVPKLDNEDRVTIREELKAAPQPYSLRFGIDTGKVDITADELLERQPDDAFESHRHNERDTLSSLTNSLESGVSGGPLDSGSYDVKSVTLPETQNSAALDRLPAASEPSGQASSLSAGASLDNLSSLATSTFGDGTADVVFQGPLADSVFLDGWQSGLPAPQADLVPAANKDLTIIAAYLVGFPSAPPPTAIGPASAAETGPTDFIVGLQSQTSKPSPARTADNHTDTSPQPSACDSSPAAPDHIATAPPAYVPTPAAADPCVVVPDAKTDSPSEQDTANEVTPSPSDSADVPEEEGGE